MPVHKWLSLKKAADMLGVHSTTLRRWADKGDIPVYITPGGHRRFLEADIRAMVDNRLPATRGGTENAWAASAIIMTQDRLRDARPQAEWMEAFDEVQRAEQRALGNHLLSLIIRHTTLPEDDDNLLDEAHDLAIRYADICIERGLSVAQGLEIVIFFRDGMFEAALQMPQVANFDEDTRLRLVRKLTQVFNLIQITLAKHYSQQK